MAAPLKRPLRLPVRAEPIVHWQHAERIAAEWVRAFGYPTAKLTGRGADLGVDVRAPGLAIAQVKNTTKVIGRELIQLLVGSRHPDCLEAMMFFSRSRYHINALTWAGFWDVALFRFDDFGNPYPENEAAERHCEQVGYDRWQKVEPPTDRVVARYDAALRREPILTERGRTVKSARSAVVAVRSWARSCGYSDATDNEDGTVTAKGLVILVRFSGPPIPASEIQMAYDKVGKRVRAAVSWVGYSKGAKSLARERSVALLHCSETGVLHPANEFAEGILAKPRVR